MIISLDSPYASLTTAGGKGMNLSLLSRNDFRVPGGFIITTEAYWTFLDVNDLEPWIADRVDPLDPGEPRGLETVSRQIRARFASGNVPLIFESELREFHLPIEDHSLAVRSSATAEDLPDTSFAGQQDTYLNVIGYPALLKAVIDCWSSLWTARAIAYRARNAIPHKTVALAVVVQEMVQSEASGVLFTANPLTGVRRQTVIDATVGLGEALVSGLVEPDHFVVDSQTLEMIDKSIGDKSLKMISAAGGGLERISQDDPQGQAVSDEVVRDLVQLGKKVAELYSSPQDVEWAFANRQLYVLQSRPVTSLYPLPPLPATPLHVLFSFGAVQGLLGPMTPLGQDAIRMIFAGGASLFRYERTHETQGAIYMAGERLWGNITPAIRNSVGRRLLAKAAEVIEPGSRGILAQLISDPRLAPERSGVRPGVIGRLLGFFLRVLPHLIRHWINPARGRRETIRKSERELAVYLARARAIGGKPDFKLKRRVELFRSLRTAFPTALPTLGVAAFSGLIPYNLLFRLVKHTDIHEDRMLELARGLPYNVTTEMDLALWETARLIHSDIDTRELFLTTRPEQLSLFLDNHELRSPVQGAIELFLEKYGSRAVGEIDFGRPRWKENHAPVMKTLQSYLRIPKERAPDIVFQRGEQVASHALQEIVAAIRNTRGGFFKARLAVWAARRFRNLAGLREAPKFAIIRMMAVVRDSLLDSAKDLVMAGKLEQREDIFFLFFNELQALAAYEIKADELKKRVRERRLTYQRELRRKQIPRILLSDGRVFYEGLVDANDSEDASVLRGSPVSPGSVTGRVRVVLDPGEADLQPGEIMVCAGTDPAWTPLFLSAGGLITEVGGMMTHGSVVAREYGIPAVVGVHQATTKLSTGMQIRLDGSSGRIEILA